MSHVSRPDLSRLNDGAIPNEGGTAAFQLQPVPIKPVGRALRQSYMRGVRGTPLSTSADAPIPLGSQHSADRKAFKGRGARRRMLKAKEAVDKVHCDMKTLAEATKSIKDRRFYLAVHTRAATGQLSLRWRRAGVSDTSHIAWSELKEFIEPLPDDLAHWYKTVNEMAIALNCQEKHNRSVWRHSCELLGLMNSD